MAERKGPGQAGAFPVIALLGALLLLLGTLGLPVAFAGRIHLAAHPAGEMELSWAWGLVGARVALGGSPPEMSWRLGALPWRRLGRKAKTLSPDRSGNGKKDGRKGFPRQWVGLLGHRGLLPRAAAFVTAVVRSLRLRLSLTGDFGTQDAALTGCLTAFLAGISGGPVELNLNPDFTAARLDLRGEWRGRLIPLRLLWLTGGFALTPPVRQLWWSKITRRMTGR